MDSETSPLQNASSSSANIGESGNSKQYENRSWSTLANTELRKLPFPNDDVPELIENTKEQVVNEKPVLLEIAKELFYKQMTRACYDRLVCQIPAEQGKFIPDGSVTMNISYLSQQQRSELQNLIKSATCADAKCIFAKVFSKRKCKCTCCGNIDPNNNVMCDEVTLEGNNRCKDADYKEENLFKNLLDMDYKSLREYIQLKYPAETKRTYTGPVEWFIYAIMDLSKSRDIFMVRSMEGLRRALFEPKVSQEVPEEGLNSLTADSIAAQDIKKGLENELEQDNTETNPSEPSYGVPLIL